MYRNREVDIFGAVPEVPRLNPGPCVEFLWTPALESVKASRASEAQRIAGRIKQLLVNKEKVVSERGATPTLRPAKAGDIVLLRYALSTRFQG